MSQSPEGPQADSHGGTAVRKRRSHGHVAIPRRVSGRFPLHGIGPAKAAKMLPLSQSPEGSQADFHIVAGALARVEPELRRNPPKGLRPIFTPIRYCKVSTRESVSQSPEGSQADFHATVTTIGCERSGSVAIPRRVSGRFPPSKSMRSSSSSYPPCRHPPKGLRPISTSVICHRCCRSLRSPSPEGPQADFHVNVDAGAEFGAVFMSQSPEGSQADFHIYNDSDEFCHCVSTSQSPEGSQADFHNTIRKWLGVGLGVSQSPEGSQADFHLGRRLSR